MKLKTEQYKGYPIKFVSKSMKEKPGEQMVVGSYPSKIVGKLLGAEGNTRRCL